MSNLKLKSEAQILGDMLTTFINESGINDINPGSVILTLLETVSQEQFQQYVQMLDIIRAFNLDTTTGSDLDTRAFEFGLARKQPVKATGKITIRRADTFSKIFSSFYAGSPSPISGSTSVDINDGSLLPGSGTLIIGRGTNNEEEVAYNTTPVDNTNFWTVTLATPLSNDHGLDESVILKQGSDQIITQGTAVVVPGTSISDEIVFTLNEDSILLSGEESISNVEVTASVAGTEGNIPINAINGPGAFPSPPFSGAQAFNESKFTTGVDRETDAQLRDRIKQHIQSLSKGTKTAVLNAIVGLVDSESAKRVVSANVVVSPDPTEPVKIYLDDGTGFEPSFKAQGFETIISSATGGETRLQLDIAPIVKAQIEANNLEPYNLSGITTLEVCVSNENETLTFNQNDFDFSTAATAEEVVAAINNKAELIEARTTEGGTGVVITAMADENEDLQVIGGTANIALSFPTERVESLYLYVDDEKLSKDGSTALVDAGTTQNYNFSGLASPWNLNLIVDGKSANPQTVTFLATDFVDPSSATASEVATVINAQIAGATAQLISSNTSIRLISKTTYSTESKVQVTGGNVNTLLNFNTSEVAGTDRDYIFNRNLGVIELQNPLTTNQVVTAGTRFPRASLRCSNSQPYTVNAGETLDITIDGGAPQQVVFSTTGVFTAAQIADLINDQIIGGSAYTRKIGFDTFLSVRTNTQEVALGSLEILSSSTATGLGFTYDTPTFGERTHKAYIVSGQAGPYEFSENENLVVVVDDDPANKTYTVNMDYKTSVDSATSTTQFIGNQLTNIFSVNDALNDFYLGVTSGNNTTTGTVTDVTDQGSDVFRYAFDALPLNLIDYAIGDIVTISDMTNTSNDGSFLITGISTTGTGYIELENLSGQIETGSTGTALIGQRRQVLDYDGTTGEITLVSGLTNTPVAGDTFFVTPHTVANLESYMNNTRITTLSTKAEVSAVDQFTKIQITSNADGSDGAVRVTGGSANTKLLFSTSTVNGIQAYYYYTGLLKLVHNTIYGDDTDSTAFEGIGAAGIQFDVLAPTVQEVEFNLNLTLAEGVSISSVEDDVKSAITGYVNSLGVGEDVIRAEIVDRVMEIDNITDMEILEPTTNIVIKDNELPRTKDSLILVG